MTLNEFVDRYLGTMVDYDGFYGGQCVDLYRQYVKDVLGFPQSPGVGGAAEIWESASPECYDFIKNDPNAVPIPGDIVIWNRRAGGGFGHVAIFLHGDVNHFTSLDQNWPTLNKVTKTEHTYSNVIGWLHPKESKMPSDKMEIEKSLFEKLVNNSGKWDGVHKELSLESDPSSTPLDSALNVIRGYKSQATDMRNKLSVAEQEIRNREEQVSRLSDEIANERNMRIAEQTALIEANKAMVKLRGEHESRVKALQEQVDSEAKQKGEALKDVARLRTEVEELKKGVTKPLTLFDVLKMILPKLFTWMKGVVIK